MRKLSTTSGQTCNIDAAMLELSSTVNPYIEGTTSPSTPMFTTTAGAYPMNIQLGTEIITLNSAPAGSTSPQSFTGVTRGAAGTAAAAQVVGTTVLLAPASTWTL